MPLLKKLSFKKIFSQEVTVPPDICIQTDAIITCLCVSRHCLRGERLSLSSRQKESSRDFLPHPQTTQRLARQQIDHIYIFSYFDFGPKIMTMMMTARKALYLAYFDQSLGLSRSFLSNFSSETTKQDRRAVSHAWRSHCYINTVSR